MRVVFEGRATQKHKCKHVQYSFKTYTYEITQTTSGNSLSKIKLHVNSVNEAILTRTI